MPPASETVEFDQEGASDDFTTELLDRVDLREGGSSCRDQVIVDQDAGTVEDRVGVNFQRV